VKRRISTLMAIIVGCTVLLTGCVFPDTGTLRIRNEMTESRVITALYIIRGRHLTRLQCRGRYRFGTESAIDAETVEADIFHTVWITDGDVL